MDKETFISILFDLGFGESDDLPIHYRHFDEDIDIYIKDKTVRIVTIYSIIEYNKYHINIFNYLLANDHFDRYLVEKYIRKYKLKKLLNI